MRPKLCIKMMVVVNDGEANGMNCMQTRGHSEYSLFGVGCEKLINQDHRDLSCGGQVLLIRKYRGTRLAQSEQHMTLDLQVLSSGSMLGVEGTK